jgi:hypothetical protein
MTVGVHATVAVVPVHAVLRTVCRTVSVCVSHPRSAVLPTAGDAGSPNFARFVYNASSGAAPPPTWKGNLYIQSLFTDYFDSKGLDYVMDEFDGRSDYEGFIEAGVPAGGAFE